MKTLTRLLIFSFLFLAFSWAANAQTKYVNSSSGANLRSGKGTEHKVITTLPDKVKVEVLKVEGDWTYVQYDGKKGYVSSKLLSSDPPKSNTKSSNNNKSASSKSSNSNVQSDLAGGNGYTTGIGLRGGFTSGITLKHFLNQQNAIELILGSRYFGFSAGALYTWNKRAFDVQGLNWQLGIGAGLGAYQGRYYYSYLNNCNDPNNPNCQVYWQSRSVFAVGVLAIGGLEYQFKDIPFTVSLDLIPTFYLNHWGRGFFDGSLSVRYIIK